MTEDSTTAADVRRRRRPHGPRPVLRARISRDLVCGLVMLAVAAFFLFNAGEVRKGQYDWLFPIVLSCTLGVLAVILVVRGLFGRGERMPVVPVILRGQGVDVAVICLITVCYVVTVDHLGFWVTSGVMIVVAAVYLDTRRSLRRTALALAVAVVTCVVGYYVLTQVFFVDFPVGPFL
jgi:O-antigen/teichoic acid export membrane protein